MATIQATLAYKRLMIHLLEERPIFEVERGRRGQCWESPDRTGRLIVAARATQSVLERGLYPQIEEDFGPMVAGATIASLNEKLGNDPGRSISTYNLLTDGNTKEVASVIVYRLDNDMIAFEYLRIPDGELGDECRRLLKIFFDALDSGRYSTGTTEIQSFTQH